MGDHYCNCMVSGLPIGCEEDAVILLLTNGMYGEKDSYIYPWSQYRISSLPIFLPADDYCFSTYLKVDSDKHYKEEEKLLKSQLAYRVLEPSLYIDDSHKNDQNNWMRCFQPTYPEKQIISGYFCGFKFDTTTKKYTDKPHLDRLYMAVVRREVWDHIIEEASKELKYGTKETIRSEVQAEFENIFITIPKEIAKLTEANDPTGALRFEFRMDRMNNRYPHDLYATHFMIDLKHHQAKMKLQDGEINVIVQQLTDMTLFSQYLRYLGRPIIPIIQSTPQANWYEDEVRDALKKMNNLTSKIISNKEKKIKEDW